MKSLVTRFKKAGSEGNTSALRRGLFSFRQLREQLVQAGMGKSALELRTASRFGLFGLRVRV